MCYLFSCGRGGYTATRLNEDDAVTRLASLKVGGRVEECGRPHVAWAGRKSLIRQSVILSGSNSVAEICKWGRHGAPLATGGIWWWWPTITLLFGMETYVGRYKFSKGIIYKHWVGVILCFLFDISNKNAKYVTEILTLMTIMFFLYEWLNIRLVGVIWLRLVTLICNFDL